MKKDIGLLICELDALAIDFDLILHTFTAVEEGITNGANKVNPLAICVPINALKNSVDELMLLKDEMFKAELKKAVQTNE